MILPMNEGNISQIAALEAANFSLPWDAASLRAELENTLALWLVLAEEERVLAYVGTQSCFEDADILSIAVLPEARRRGIAEALLRELERLLPARGVERITLEVRASNEPALALYRKLGYEALGLRKNYYEKPREDALIMQKRISLDPDLKGKIQ
ncbi:MAG: ribosomal protein S18-alanine N-acetyltransferase [Oscillospiraceae bacterium]|nr:ribosomal protein S18-alanine N-acetyltransferase [Oscillospiraceae bacterium]